MVPLPGIAPLALGLIQGQGQVGMLNEFVGLRQRQAIAGYTDTDAELYQLTIDRDGFSQRLEDRFGQLDHLGAAAAVLQQDTELISHQAGDHGVRAQLRLQSPGNEIVTIESPGFIEQLQLK